jgi:hypothetical protein
MFSLRFLTRFREQQLYYSYAVLACEEFLLALIHPPLVAFFGPSLRDDYNDKLSLITESVVVTRIDIHPTREKPDQHDIRLTPGGSHV